MSSEEDLRKLATYIKELKLAQPARFLLEAHLPLQAMFLNLSLIGQPLVSPFLGAERFSFLQRILADEDSFNRLLEMLEEE